MAEVVVGVVVWSCRSVGQCGVEVDIGSRREWVVRDCYG